MAKPKSVNDYLVEKLGLGDAFRLEVFLTLWGMFIDVEGHEPSPAEWVELFGGSERTYYRRLGQWREAFPEHRTPTVLVGQWRKQARGRLNARRLGRLPLRVGST